MHVNAADWIGSLLVRGPRRSTFTRVGGARSLFAKQIQEVLCFRRNDKEGDEKKHETRTCTQSRSGEVGKREGAQAKPLRRYEPWHEALADSRYLVSYVSYIGAKILLGTNTLLNSGLFLLTALTGRIPPIRHLPAWLLLPLPYRGVFSGKGSPWQSRRNLGNSRTRWERESPYTAQSTRGQMLRGA